MIYLISTLIFKVIFIYPIGSGYNCQLVFPLIDQFLIKLQTSSFKIDNIVVCDSAASQDIQAHQISFIFHSQRYAFAP